MQRCQDKERWDDYVLENEGHPLQLWGWGQVKASHGWKAERYCIYDDHEQVAAMQVLIRHLPFPFRSFAYVPRGPVGDESYFAEALDVIAGIVKRDYKPVAFSVEPISREMKLTEVWRKTSNEILSRETIILNLLRSESDLLADMAKKTRQYIRKSAAEDIEIRRIKNNAEFNDCLKIYRETAARAGFNLHDESYYRDVWQQMGDHSPIFAAFSAGVPVAFLWLAISASTAYELYGGVNDEGQALRANYALKWHAIRTMKEWGLEVYDFGGLVAGGVSTFKQQWSSEPYEFLGTFEKPLSPLYGLWNVALPRAKALMQKLRRR